MIIPKPTEIKINENHFILKDNFVVYLDPKLVLENINIFITDHIVPPTKFQFQIEKSNHDNAQLCFVYNENIPKEGYELELTADKLIIQSSTPSGHLYGLITFMQLFPPEIFSETKVDTISSWEAPCVTIKDSPQFSWRGMHLDCSRHFFTVDEVKKFIYWMSLHKLNTFHWHLTDDQGWRFESINYPKLNQISSKRLENDGSQYGPFYYTQEEMKDIVRYAKTLSITIIPEIEMPGHSDAVFEAYPELCCNIKVPRYSYWARFRYIKCFCLSNPSSITFLKNILTEVMNIFDSEYIHIGGDEVIPLYWETCKHCQEFMHKNGLKDAKEYQNWFTKLISDFLNEKGRKMIGWDEIINEDLPKNNTIMIWRNSKIALKATNLGFPIILVPNEFYYFDHRQFSKNYDDSYDYFVGPVATLKTVYEADPFSSIQNKELVLGVQACAWSEVMNNFKNVQWKVFPRICALSEVAWTRSELRNYDDFKERMKNVHYNRLKILNINYANK